jgi:hypothetical protein
MLASDEGTAAPIPKLTTLRSLEDHMRKRAGLLVATVVAAGVFGQASASAAQAGPEEPGVPYETVATLDARNTENIFQAQGGTIYVTAHEGLKIFRIAPDRRVDTFVTMPSDVLGIAGIRDGFVVTTSERPFRKPDAAGRMQFDFSDTGPGVAFLDKKGAITATLPGAKGSFFNGIAAATASGGRDLILIADSSGGTIWRVDAAKKQIEPWLKDPALAPTKDAPVGADGIKIHNGWVYVNSRGAMYRVRVGADGQPQGILTLIAPDVGNNDFDLTRDGTLYIIVMSSMKKISASGEVSTVYEKVPPGPAAFISRDGKWVYWSTRGGDGPQHLLRAPVR